MAAAICGYSDRYRVVHVEAGLRSFDLDQPFPEEFNRRVISIAAALHLAPSEESRAHLLKEGIAEDRCHVVGNTVIDALLWTISGDQGGNRPSVMGRFEFWRPVTGGKAGTVASKPFVRDCWDWPIKFPTRRSCFPFIPIPPWRMSSIGCWEGNPKGHLGRAFGVS